MQPERQAGNADDKRRKWTRKCRVGKEVKFSIKCQKKVFQRKLRNGKYVELPANGNSYRKAHNPAANWDMVT